MNPRDFFTLAERLVAESTESAQRSAVSRAYYAVFHEARMLVESCGFRFASTAETHSKLIYCIMAANDADLDFVGQKLGSLRTIRNTADYDLGITNFASSSFAISQLQVARLSFEALERAKSRTKTFRPLVRQYAASVLKKVLEGDE